MHFQPKLGFIGAGKVGTTLARLLNGRGYALSGVFSRNVEHAAALADSTRTKVLPTVNELVSASDFIFLTVSDDALGAMAHQLASSGVQGKAFVHTSGAHEAVVLQPLADYGAMIGSFHPVFPFAAAENTTNGLAGVTFAIQADAVILRDWLLEMVSELDGQILLIGNGQKALYHSALVFASNYGVTLYAIAQRILESLGAQPYTASQALNALVKGMVQNIAAQGIPDALTGPLVRGDVGTIEAHLTALASKDVALRELYVRLAQQSLPLAAARGVDVSAVETILRRAIDDADHYT